MTCCPDRALRRRLLKISWTNTGTSRGSARAMAPQVELLTMEQEVRMNTLFFYLDITHFSVDTLNNLPVCVSTDLCGDDNVHDSPREDTLQNISTDDLPDSASQTAQQHDTKFSFRSEKTQNLEAITQHSRFLCRYV